MASHNAFTTAEELGRTRGPKSQEDGAWKKDCSREQGPVIGAAVEELDPTPTCCARMGSIDSRLATWSLWKAANLLPRPGGLSQRGTEMHLRRQIKRKSGGACWASRGWVQHRRFQRTGVFVGFIGFLRAGVFSLEGVTAEKVVSPRRTAGLHVRCGFEILETW